MARIDIKSSNTGGSVATGVLQLQNGVAMTTTLTAVTDQSNTASPLLLSTTGVQTLSKIQISTADTNYIDAEDNSGNNRFTVGRDPASQQVNVDFASNPGGSTELVGGFRTYVDGTNLSNVVNIRRDGQLQIGSTAASAMYWDNTNNRVGIGTATPGVKLDVHSGADNIAQLNRTGAGKSLLQYLLTGTARWATGFDNTNGNYTIYDAVNATDRVVVSNTGRLGVGTNNPQTVGHFRANGSTNGVLSVVNANDTTNYGSRVQLYDKNSGDPVIDGANGFGLIYTDSVATSYLWNFSNGPMLFGTSGVERMRLNNNGGLTIKGSGSTSATTSLLVQNSAGSTNLIVTDDQVIKGYAGASLRFQFGGSSQAGISTRNGALCVGYIDSSFQNGLQISAEGSGKTFIDGWNDGGSLQYDIVVGRQGSRTQFGTDSASVSSAQVAINSTTRGFLPPRMTNAQRLAIATPAVGLMVYCTDAVEGLYVYKSTGWTFVI